MGLISQGVVLRRVGVARLFRQLERKARRLSGEGQLREKAKGVWLAQRGKIPGKGKAVDLISRKRER